MADTRTGAGKPELTGSGPGISQRIIKGGNIMLLERKEETKTVKESLTKLGYQNVKATHGRGTAWGWLTVEVSTPRPAGCTCDFDNPHRYPYYCDACRDTLHTNRTKITEILLETTGRSRTEYDGNTIVDVNLLEPAWC